MVARGALLKVAAGILVLAVVGGGAALYSVGSDFQQPRVESIENEFGAVSQETTTIQTQVVVRNPNDEALPGAATISYEVYLNDVAVGDGSKSGIGLQPGRNEISLDTQLDNGKIPAWWVTHVNNGERTTLTTAPSISVAGISTDLPNQTQTFETDLLGSFQSNESRTVTVANESILEVGGQRASWGEATAETTPIVVETELTNVHDDTVQLDGTAYTIRMNGIVVGNGTTAETLSLDPGESTTYTVTPAIDTPRMEQWWVSHLRNGQQTELTVEVYGVVERDGERQRVPVTIYEQRAAFTTDLLGDGETTVEPLPTNDTAFAPPELAGTQSTWGEVTETTTTIDTQVAVRNPNAAAFEFLTLDFSQRTTVGGVEAASGATTVEGLPAGTSTFTLESTMPHDRVPRWWAAHVNNGERSVLRTTTNGTADLGVTTVDIAAPDEERVVETHALAGFTQSEDERIRQQGRTVLVITETSATWGEATRQEAPITVTAVIENRQARTVTIDDIHYRVGLNSVTLANRTSDQTFTIAPYSTRTVELTMRLDNTKMADWWPTHVRNGETSTLTTEVDADVSTSFGTRRVALDSFAQNSTIETDLLGQEEE
ncbi:LEA type 2 family protein [Natronomonas sp. EA1]|uniref:LEA type 2 family protein n=1 Tax=Natronomonas sp. EA1 TaxID=3421655 RepID=UPI003EBAAB85